jgi:ribosome recycling factor
MKKKLTLTIDQEVVKQAKRYAKQRHRSVSRMVEDYLKRISTGESASTKIESKKPSLTDSITGMFSSEYQGQDYDRVLESALMEKHL